MEEDLPNEFDVIVLGTGMPESILAAAAARSGKTVLHLDHNDFYGADWGSFNFENLRQWATNHQDVNKTDFVGNKSSSQQVDESEVLVILPPKCRNSFNVRVHEFVPESIDIERSQDNDTLVNQPKDTLPVEENEIEVRDKDITEGANTGSGTEAKEIQSNIQSNEPINTIVKEAAKKQWSIDELLKLKRKFNLDLAPKLLFARGPLVELLIQSNMSRYSEFKCSSQILTLLEGKLMPVPCSRADVFSTKHVSIVEKRMLMKFLKFCLDFEEHPEEFADFETKPFIKFLNSKKLTKNVEHYLIHSIAMVHPNNSTLDSLRKIQKFLQSLGRYSNSPFLFPLYGSGEMPQCFCRLCAVFGGVYCLKQQVDALILNHKHECVAVIVNNKRINCKFFAMECGYSPKDYLPKEYSDQKISKAILITDGSVYPSEQDQLTFLRLPACDTFENAISVLELGPSSNICPDGLRVVYMSCKSHKDVAEVDLLPAVQLLFNSTNTADPKSDSAEDETAEKPDIIWALYMNQYDNSQLELNKNTPKNVFLFPTTDIEQDYENAIAKAHAAFLEMFPSEDFLPRAPEPEEIIMDSDEPEKNEKSNEDVVENNDGEVVASAIEELTVEKHEFESSDVDTDKTAVTSETDDSSKIA